MAKVDTPIRRHACSAQRPTWLDLGHKTVDNAVLAAYKWPHDITDEAILERLLALNLERAKDRIGND